MIVNIALTKRYCLLSMVFFVHLQCVVVPHFSIYQAIIVFYGISKKNSNWGCKSLKILAVVLEVEYHLYCHKINRMFVVG